jgi:hypothetical protein
MAAFAVHRTPGRLVPKQRKKCCLQSARNNISAVFLLCESSTGMQLNVGQWLLTRKFFKTKKLLKGKFETLAMLS